jgi:LysM repeat protein/ABC-type branched-subunit amino acid transport system substrate-binding protein
MIKSTIKYSKLIILILTFLSLNPLSAQIAVQVEKSTSIQTIDGHEYYLHKVEKGQTLWAITRAYNCTEEQIKQANPEYQGILSIGQILKIPKDVKLSRRERRMAQDSIREHIVQRGETLFGIARSYEVNVDSLIRMNQLTGPDISPGQRLLIPPPLSMITPAVEPQTPGQMPIVQPLADKSDSVRSLRHIVNKGETLYSLSRVYGTSVDELIDLNPAAAAGLNEGMVLIIPDLSGQVIKESVMSKTPEVLSSECTEVAASTYRVALMMPFFSSDVDRIIIRTDDIKPPSVFRSFNFIQFYEGMLLALDELEKQGVRIKLHVYDTYRSSEVVGNILTKPELKSMDMIIGPFFPNLLESVADFAIENGIIHVTPFVNIPDRTGNHSNMVKLQPSVTHQLKSLADFACDSLENPYIILVHNNTDDQQEYIRNAREDIHNMLIAKGVPMSNFKEVNFMDGGLNGLKSALSKEKNNLIITNISGEAFVTGYLTNLNKIRDDFSIYLVINPAWLGYNNIDLEHLVNLKGVGYSSYYIDYNSEEVADFIREFRQRYNTEPDAYAFQGYDITRYFFTAIHNYGNDFVRCMGQIKMPLMHTNYNFQRISADGAVQNSTVNIFMYQDYNTVLKYRK